MLHLKSSFTEKRRGLLEAILLFSLLFFEFSIHSLGIGPDRRIHDPAVYRLWDVNYLPGDWYTEMATESGVYTFYAKMVNFWHFLPVSEETWRMLLYLGCLIVLYWALLRIGRFFSESAWIIPVVAFFHALVIVIAPPIWLYGPFIQVDGGLAPRSIGMTLSFLALYFLLNNSRFLPWVLLGLATLVHVSNSLIVFTLFFGTWIIFDWWARNDFSPQYWHRLFRKALVAGSVYLLAGGWFAFSIARLGNGGADFSDAKFIWTWIYFRAPYMALPIITWKAWFLFFVHILALGVSWYILRKKMETSAKNQLDFLGLIGVGAVGYFFLFYFFAFVWPWLPGFQFYSLRVIYLTHFVSYLFSALLAVSLLVSWLQKRTYQKIFLGVLLAASILFCLSTSGKVFADRMMQNISRSWEYATHSEARNEKLPESGVMRYLAVNPEPFLAPPNWFGPPFYVPHAVSFKTFGFTPQGLEEWYERMNDMSRGELEQNYEKQKISGTFKAVFIDWKKTYSSFSEEEITSLARKYGVNLVLTYSNISYPFEVISEDVDYRLYRLSK